MTERDVAGTLVVSATRAEANYVPPGTRLLITGIGKVRAATVLTRELVAAQTGAAEPVTEVINIGTAGALHDHHSGLFVPSTVIEHDISSDALRAMGYDIVDTHQFDGDGSVLATGDTFIADPVARAELSRRADLVDMEGAAIAYVCASFGVDLTVVKAVSDGADEQATDWPSLVDAAALDLGRWLAAR
ncbi:nucleosidase [Gordonia sp. CPCC 205333]|uniref:nucleosidase n=1 Tax=Gordonia sp. CPCC 205333 TaxID=3140790 RepID=UPI003AF38C26